MYLIRKVVEPTYTRSQPFRVTDDRPISILLDPSIRRTPEIEIYVKLTNEKKQSLFRAINNTMYLNKLSLINTGLNDQDIKSLLEAYISRKITSRVDEVVNLEHIDLSGNQIGELGIGLLGLFISHRGLKTLKIRNNAFPIDGKRLSQALSTNLSYIKLEELDLSYCDINERDLLLIFEAAAHVKSIKTLRFSNLKNPSSFKKIIRKISNLDFRDLHLDFTKNDFTLENIASLQSMRSKMNTVIF